jgi:hypothetical protein
VTAKSTTSDATNALSASKTRRLRPVLLLAAMPWRAQAAAATGSMIHEQAVSRLMAC